jgi:hypothetical protein
MFIMNRRLGPPSCAAVLFAGFLLVPLAGLALARAQAQEPASSPAPAAAASQISLRDRAPAQISPADAALLHARRHEIVSEAAFFGYDLSAHGWSFDQVACPWMPDDVLLQYRRRSRDGAQSLFTALVPRQAGRVLVVPVLYRSATPFQSAIGSERSIAVFNRAVSADVAQKAAQPGSQWLSLALCYAELVGAQPHVPQESSNDIGLIRAPEPTLHISNTNDSRQIVFSDQEAAGRYQIWTIMLNGKGRLTAATASTLSDYVAHATSEAMPREKRMPPAAEPPEKPLPPAVEPPEKPLPPTPQPPTTPVPQ